MVAAVIVVDLPTAFAVLPRRGSHRYFILLIEVGTSNRSTSNRSTSNRNSKKPRQSSATSYFLLSFLLPALHTTYVALLPHFCTPILATSIRSTSISIRSTSTYVALLPHFCTPSLSLRLRLPPQGQGTRMNLVPLLGQRAESQGSPGSCGKR